ncbi:MAG TPA: nucleotidyl transferase AbiEii/AbiGii toxin family protein [Aquella sp.]|nr:nucleotidyl transferase AbiEii/AbiGii toxin family protein [Aquella sp.]
MSVEVIQEKLASYKCNNILEQENALKEITQEIALMSLSRSGFFSLASFQGGTCLRILYNLERFSEDLDFALDRTDTNFDWTKYIANMREEFEAYGFTLEIKQPARSDKAVKTAELKTNSVGGILIINDTRTNNPKLRIKLEVDTVPPLGATTELKYLDFPLPYSIKTHDMQSLFAGKCHALLCRNYVKGRDWYDFVWYISRQIQPNFILLNNSIMQAGPWAGQNIKVTKELFLTELEKKISNIDWDAAKQDIARFLRPQQLPAIQLWNTEFFLSRVEKFAEYLLTV